MRVLTTLLAFSFLLACSASDPASGSGSDSGGTDQSDDLGSSDDLGPSDDVPQPEEVSVSEDIVPAKQWPKAPEMLGGDRPSRYVLPDQYDSNEQWPLLLLLHGYGANIGNPELSGGDVQDTYLGISKRVNERGFIMLIPHGTLDASNSQFWNATDYCCDFYGQGIDDVGYLTGLLDEAAVYFNVDPKRIYLLGHSNGGFMSYRLACEVGERIAALAAIAGTSYWDPAKCTPAASSVSVLQIHGTDDQSIGYNGSVPGMNGMNPGGYCGAEEIVDRWVERNSCQSGPKDAEAIDIIGGNNGAETSVTEWSECQDGTEVALWTLNDIGHIPGFTADFSTVVLDFLLKQKRP
jgi:polyhydroxybutyrate depolymerase